MQFRGKYYFLSNMYPCKVTVGLETGVFTFSCSEAAFQACKDPSQVQQFIGIDGFEAKRKGRKLNLDLKQWESIRDECMELVVQAKFEQNPDLMRQLLAVKGEIAEENTWKDMYWGQCKVFDHVDEVTREPAYIMKGENKLGKILMKIRDSHMEQK